jgi:cytidylate kinase
MSIVTISRGSYSHGKEVAEKLAQKLGYTCISREVILKASEHFNVPEIKLARAIHDAPSIFDRLTYGRERYIAYIRETLLHHFVKDNMVYHGLAGHFFVQGLPHVLKVRILADIEDRVAEEMKRQGISAEEARAFIQKDDEDRYCWSYHLYGIDTQDPLLYDLVIHLKSMGIDDAVSLIECTLKRSCFLTTPESQKAIENFLLAAQVQAALVNEIPSAKVEVEDGEIMVNLRDTWGEGKKLIAKVEKISDNVGGVKVKVRLVSP